MFLWPFKQAYVLCFELISPGLFRKDFITEDFLDIHEKPFEKAKQKRKRLFCTTGICKCAVVFKLKIHNLQIFRRLSDIKFSLILNYSSSKGASRTKSNICDGAFCKRS